MKQHNHSLIDIDNIAINSPLKNVNPQLKIIFSLIMLFLSISFDNISISIFIGFSMILVLNIVCKLRLHQILKLMEIPVFFIIISCITIILQFKTSPEFTIFVTKESFISGIAQFFKAYSAITCLYFLNVTTKMTDIIYTLQKIKIPNIIIELMYLIYRYLFLLFEIQNKMIISANSRLGYISYKTKWYTFVHIAGNVLITSFKRSSKCFDAMESRCFEGKLLFYTEKSTLNLKHVAYFSSYLLIVLVFIFIVT